MRKLTLVVLALCFVATFAWAQEAVKGEEVKAEVANAEAVADVAAKTEAPAAETMTINGTLIDNLCAGAHKEDLAEFVKAHPKSCAIMPDCVASGYSLVSDGTITKLDNDSNAKIAEFLKKEDSLLQVEVSAVKVGEELSLVSIENQKETK